MHYYKKNGRHALPWRKTRDPYRILVSEMMLQQTQVARVIPKYKAFLERFPTLESLADAELGEVYRMWQGLGYNRRARFLRDAARVVVGATAPATFPKTIEALEDLPGVGPYTARAVYTFAYNKPCVVVETNVRTCVLHHFFPHAKKGQVRDAEIEKIIAVCMDEIACKKIHPRAWYSALMDYGTYIKEAHGNPNTRSSTHVVQKKFKGSVREVRGAIVRLLVENKTHMRAITCGELQKKLPQFDTERTTHALRSLVKDGTVTSVQEERSARFHLSR